MNYLSKRYLYGTIIGLTLSVILLALFLIHNQSKTISSVPTNCIKQDSSTTIPLKLSSTDPSKFTGRDLQEFVHGGYNYVYYFIADGSQLDAIGKPYPVGQVVLSGPDYFTSSSVYASDVKPALNEIASLNSTDKQTYIAGQGFHSVVANAVNTFNQSHINPAGLSCNK